jgi:hypothetical protein
MCTKCCGADHLAVVLPARERFHADHLAVDELRLRLEPRHDLAFVQGTAQVGDLDVHVFVLLHVVQVLFVAREQFLELLDAQGLFDGAQHVQPVGARHHLHGVEQGRIQRADQGDRAREAALGHVADELDAIHAGHVEVDQDHVGRGAHRLQHGERRGAVGRFQHLADAEVREQPQRHPALEAVVLHHHHTQCGQAHPCLPGPRDRSSVLLRMEGKQVAKGRGDPGPASRRCYNSGSFFPALPRDVSHS